MTSQPVRFVQQAEALLYRMNRIFAMLLGIVLVLTVIFIIVDVGLRGMHMGSLGGSDEISGYVMAAVASWGLAYALVERAHVRIDIIRQMVAPPGRVAMDLLAMIATNAVVLLVAYHAWPVLAKTLQRGSRANTPLETPLWIPQSIWFGGWIWFAISVTALTLIGIAYLATGRTDDFEATLGMGNEVEEELDAARNIEGTP